MPDFPLAGFVFKDPLDPSEITFQNKIDAAVELGFAVVVHPPDLSVVGGNKVFTLEIWEPWSLRQLISGVQVDGKLHEVTKRYTAEKASIATVPHA